MATSATLLSYAAGIAVGLIAGYPRTLIDPIRCAGRLDPLLPGDADPSLLARRPRLPRLGSDPRGGDGSAAGDRPDRPTADPRGVPARLRRGRKARGEGAPGILPRESCRTSPPSSWPTSGIRFGAAIIFIASVNYLGLGLEPPASDWGLMISENQQYIGTNIWGLAPATMLAMLTIGVNLVADSYARVPAGGRVTRRRRGPPGHRRRARALQEPTPRRRAAGRPGLNDGGRRRNRTCRGPRPGPAPETRRPALGRWFRLKGFGFRPPGASRSLRTWRSSCSWPARPSEWSARRARGRPRPCWRCSATASRGPPDHRRRRSHRRGADDHRAGAGPRGACAGGWSAMCPIESCPVPSTPLHRHRRCDHRDGQRPPGQRR